MGTGTALSGMKAIREFCGSIGLPRTEASIIQLKLQCGFPMKKLLGNWESDKEMIVEWRKKYVQGEIEASSDPSTIRQKMRRKT